MNSNSLAVLNTLKEAIQVEGKGEDAVKDILHHTPSQVIVEVILLLLTEEFSIKTQEVPESQLKLNFNHYLITQD